MGSTGELIMLRTDACVHTDARAKKRLRTENGARKMAIGDTWADGRKRQLEAHQSLVRGNCQRLSRYRTRGVAWCGADRRAGPGCEYRIAEGRARTSGAWAKEGGQTQRGPAVDRGWSLCASLSPRFTIDRRRRSINDQASHLEAHPSWGSERVGRTWCRHRRPSLRLERLASLPRTRFGLLGLLVPCYDSPLGYSIAVVLRSTASTHLFHALSCA